ncbi:MAG: sulfatase [Planctomycetes bacterium]|nr:sulfatase [Planctomycetota bacterium]
MNRVVLWMCVAGLELLTGVVTAEERPPNVVMIISDDQAWTDYGFLGHETIRTPRLDQLARESAVFTRGYVPSSLCRPSLVTIITGLYPHQHGVTGNDPPRGVDRGEMLKHIDRAETLPDLLARKDYLSLQTGKWWEGGYRRGGFTHGMTHGDVSRGGRHGDEGLEIGRQGLQPIFDFIEEADDRPFFVWYAPFLPHTPHNPPERLLKKYLQDGRSPYVASYYAMCEWFDETCGELLNYLDTQELSDETLVAYVTDNGWIQQENARGYAPRSKRSPNEGGIRTPIMLRWPGKIKPMRDETTLASSIDLAPTILHACGVAAPESLPGVDLLSGAAQERETIFGEIFEHDVTDINDPHASLLYRWCIDSWWKLILPKDGENPELYNLKDDPFEKRNLASANPDIVRRLTEKLDAWWSLDNE